jgi:hypothetical protein
MSGDAKVEEADCIIDPNAGFNAYRQYVSLKNHFNSSYDWNKYKGRTQVSENSFGKRKDKKFFQIIESKYSTREINQIFLANLVYNKHLWIGELLSENCVSIWHDWQGRLSRIDYQFEEDVKNCLLDIQNKKHLSKIDSLKFLIKKPQDTHPLVLRFVWGGMFGIESYLLLSLVLNLKKIYRPFLTEDRLWADFEYKIEKYESFLRPKLNIEKAKQTLKTLTTE